jgi:RNA polymerase sigma factor (sigma-70 family)
MSDERTPAREGEGAHRKDEHAQGREAAGARRDDDPADATLMERFGRGDDDAFRVLVRRHEGGLLRYFFRRCQDRTLAEDCTQEVFLRLVRHRGRWRPDAKFTTYLYRIAENHWIDRWRSRKAGPQMSSLDETAASGDDGQGLSRAQTVEAPVRAPHAAASDLEVGARVRAALARLTEEQRSVFVLAEVRGMKYADIAETLGIPVGTVKSRMHAVTTRLRELLEEDGLEL